MFGGERKKFRNEINKKKKKEKERKRKTKRYKMFQKRRIEKKILQGKERKQNLIRLWNSRNWCKLNAFRKEIYF